MAVLHVRNVPDDLYRLVQQIAVQKNTTLTHLVIQLFREKVQEEARRTQHQQALGAFLDSTAKRPLSTNNTGKKSPSATDLIDSFRADLDARHTPIS